MKEAFRVAVVVGTRPEAIKMAPVVWQMENHPAFEPLLVSTGQHKELLAQALKVLDVAPCCDLSVMKAGQSLSELTARLVDALDSAFRQLSPHAVLVHGDTTSCFAGGLAAFYNKIPLGHVEAGLRTRDKWSPYPEEMNRRLVGGLADFHYAPTATARENLLKEGVAPVGVVVTGNTVVDALHRVSQMVTDKKKYTPALEVGERLELYKKVVLITGHRRESFGAGFQGICSAIALLAEKHPDTAFVYPVHLNPQVRAPVFDQLGARPNILLIAPLDYFDFVWLLNKAFIVMTDSGGVQEEAAVLGKKVLILREKTERPEVLDGERVFLVGTNPGEIVSGFERMASQRPETPGFAGNTQLGDGRAAERIVNHLKSVL